MCESNVCMQPGSFLPMSPWGTYVVDLSDHVGLLLLESPARIKANSANYKPLNVLRSLPGQHTWWQDLRLDRLPQCMVVG